MIPADSAVKRRIMAQLAAKVSPCTLSTVILSPTVFFQSLMSNAWVEGINQLAKQQEQEFVRPRWPYDMRPSARAEKYIRDAGP